MFDRSLRAARYVPGNLGLSEFEAAELEKLFFKFDRRAMELAEFWQPGMPVSENEAYVARARKLTRISKRPRSRGSARAARPRRCSAPDPPPADPGGGNA